MKQKAEKVEDGQPAAAEKENRELTPAEVIEHLSKLKERYCKQFAEKTGAEIIFPKDTKIGDMDVSGKSLEFVLNTFIAKLDTYEPPIVQKQFEGEKQEEEKNVPAWLAAHKELIWHGSLDNPLWQVQGQQNKDKVTVSYERRGITLNPGRDEEDQDRALETVKNTFSLDEWKVLQKVFDSYMEIEADIQSEDEEKRKAAKERVRSVLADENAFRKGSGDEPTMIKKEIAAAVKEVMKTTRGFSKDAVNNDTLTQNAAEILSQLLVLNRTRGDGKEHIPKVCRDVKEFPSFDMNLERLVECLATQNEQKKGMTLMIGEAGTGKNIAVEYFAANANRPFYWFPCGRGMEAIDLVAHYEFTTEEGTKRFLTDLVRGVQTPGAVIMIDEVNSLKPEVQAMLHGLGDANRTIKYDGINIPVAEDVLIIIAGNPATYGSAGNLGEALLSRTRGQSMVMEYPSLTKGELVARKENWTKEFLEQREQEDNTLKDYACDEILIMYSELNEFSGITEEEFSLIWDVVVNETTQGTKVTELEKNEKLSALLKGTTGDHIRKTLVDMRDILRIADMWRKKFERKEGGFDIVGISMRDTIALTRAYKQKRDVRNAYLTIIDDYKKNPIDGLEVTYAAAEKLITDVLGAK